MHVDHEKNALCDSYIVEFDFDPTCNYYERGKYVCRNFHVTKSPLVMLRVVIFLCLQIMKRMLYVMVILLNFFMMLLIIIMGEEHMLVGIAIISSLLCMLCLFCLPMQVDSCSHKLFAHKIPIHRKRVRPKCVSHNHNGDLSSLLF